MAFSFEPISVRILLSPFHQNPWLQCCQIQGTILFMWYNQTAVSHTSDNFLLCGSLFLLDFQNTSISILLSVNNSYSNFLNTLSTFQPSKHWNAPWLSPKLPFFKRYYLFIYLFLERGERREKERERNINVWLPLMSSHTEDLACNPGMCPDWESNQWPFGSQTSAQSTEPRQPGL